ncbi:cupin domain-containing protein [Roseivirga echinicomitans]|uniref:Cupin type-2 domain-containing protein n=1 Tax=Roseivirga echinicomitans TaxID=296218 RepID=A0A150X9X7_9BACT|nr:cupin domain-containing protein [Roseivirga echinicomitans]KYG75496.1 hypothetical protein AWN68_08100 [Roseivirga echinicomitans]
MNHQFKINALEYTEGKVKGFAGSPLLELKNGAVKMVKVAAHSEYPKHVHPQKTEYAFVVEGTPEFEIDDNTYQCQPGEFYVFPTQAKHKIVNKGDGECVLLIGSINN